MAHTRIARAEPTALLRREYPNGRMVGAVKAARAVGSWLVRKYMLSHAVPDTFVPPNDGNAGAFLLSSRCLNKNMGYGALPHDHPWPLTFPHQNEGNANAFLLTSHRFHREKGYGALPHGYPWPLTFPHPNDGNATAFFPPLAAFIERRGMGLCPMITPRP